MVQLELEAITFGVFVEQNAEVKRLTKQIPINFVFISYNGMECERCSIYYTLAPCAIHSLR